MLLLSRLVGHGRVRRVIRTSARGAGRVGARVAFERLSEVGRYPDPRRVRTVQMVCMIIERSPRSEAFAA